MFMITVMVSGNNPCSAYCPHTTHPTPVFPSEWIVLCFLVQIIKTNCIFLEEELVSVGLLLMNPFLRLLLSLSSLFNEGLSLPFSFPGLQQPQDAVLWKHKETNRLSEKCHTAGTKQYFTGLSPVKRSYHWV